MNEDGKEIRMNIPKPQRLSSSDLFNLVTEQLVKPPLSTVRFASPHMNLVNETLIHDAISLSKSQDGSILSYLAEYSGSPFLGDELSVHNFFNLSNDSWEKSARFIKNDLNNTNSVDSHHNRDSSYSSCLLKMPVVANISELANDSEIITNSWILPQIIACLPNEIIYQFLELPNIFLNSTIEHEKEDQDSYDSSLLFPSSWISLGNVLLAKPLVGKDKIYWEPRFLVLLDNCLFEFNQSNQIVGFAHLAGAKIAEIVLDSSVGPVSKYLTISFSETSNASMMGQFCISVQDCSRIQYLMQILVKASQLNVRDLFTIDSDKEKALLGKGRFNEVLKARRNGFSYQQFLKETLEQSNEGITLDSDLISKISGEPNIAIKAISKEVFWGKVKTGKERSDAIVREVLSQLLLSLKYSSKSFFPFVKIFGFFETQKGFLLELELMQELDLFDKLAAVGTISEENVQLIIARLVGAVCLMCHQGIAHRDIKLSNITFSIQEAEQLYDCKLADFGMAGFIGKDKKLRGRCGTPGYVAPDILSAGFQEPYHSNVDMFSIGVVAFTLLCGYEPFYGADDQELLQANKNLDFEFHSPEWDNISHQAKDWILNVLKEKGSERLDPISALYHPWLRDTSMDIILHLNKCML